MPKRIGIITFHRAINYGAVMQSYGLWAALKGLGAEPELIDYRNEHIEESYRLTWGLRKSASGVRQWAPTVPLRQIKADRFRAFAANELTLSEPCTREDITQVASKYDAVITGSDQVFNPKIFDRDPAYFCDFVPDGVERYSYAASLGDYVFDAEEDREFVNLLNRFECVSVRESSSVGQMDALTDAPIRVDVDPTLLLDAEAWNALLPEERIREKPYVFLYSVHPFKSGLSQAKALSEETGLEVVYLHNRIKDARPVDEDGAILLHDSSPYDWLRYIRDADCVITNSFHGTVLSVVFGSKFLSEVDTGGGFNNRIWRLLHDCGLTSRVLEKSNLESVSIVDEALADIDWSHSRAYLDERRRDSMQYLAEICG